MRICYRIVMASMSCAALVRLSAQEAPRPEQSLTVADKAELIDALRLQVQVGDQVWPGFARARIPVVLYGDSTQFLITDIAPAAPWVLVAADRFDGRPYYRTPVVRASSFAVRVGDRWAGSLSTLDRMNRKMPRKLGRDVHTVALLHEMFHAFQATSAPERFRGATAAYAAVPRYPFGDSAFAEMWTREGALLAAALRAPALVDKRRAIREFLQLRDARRAHAALNQELVALETALEWLEGLGKYAEVRFHELAAARRTDSTYAAFGSGLPYTWDLFVLERQLGRQPDDLRFYLSGMAQARLLDALSPAWKAQAMHATACLEDLLRAAVSQEAPDASG